MARKKGNPKSRSSLNKSKQKSKELSSSVSTNTSSNQLLSNSRRKSTPTKKTNKSVVIYQNRRKSSSKKLKSSKALQNIRFLQRTYNLLIPKLPFSRLVREIMMDICNGDLSSVTRVSRMALEALQESSEGYLINLFSDANLLANHAKRVTLRNNDIALLLVLRDNAK